MSNVLVVGNIIKDVYLQFSEENFELDANKTPWLDLAFDGSCRHFFQRSSILAGAAVTLEVLKNLGIEAEVSGCNIDPETRMVTCPSNGACKFCNFYRYILCRDKNITYFESSHYPETEWIAPTKPVDWIFIDRSAKISPQLIRKIESYLAISRETKLAAFISLKNKITAQKKLTQTENDLVELADLIFVDGELKIDQSKTKICRIDDAEISLGDTKEYWTKTKANLITDLTLHSIIAATVFAAIANRVEEKLALKLAKLNVENCKINHTLTKKEFKKFLEKERQKRANLKIMAKSFSQRGRDSDMNVVALDSLEGSDLNEYLRNSYKIGSRFVKWRVAFEFKNLKTPSQPEIERQAKILATRAFESQKQGLVPIIDLKTSKAKDLRVSVYKDFIKKILDKMMAALEKSEVELESCVLKYDFSVDEAALREEDVKEILNYHIPSDLAEVLPEEN